MFRNCARTVAATLVILSLSLSIGQATLAGQADQDQRSRIQQKVERLQTLIQQLQQEGVDPQPVGELMRAYEPLMQEQKLNEAEALLDHALDVANKLVPPAQAGAQGAAGEPEYLIFQMSTEKRDLEGRVPEVKAEFGAQPAGSPRYVGFSVALLTFTTPIEELRRRVTRALDDAEKSGLPVAFQLDDMNFLPEYSDPSMVEWTAFPKPGETVGPRAEHYWLNWFGWMALPPPPNFESPAIRAEVQKRLREGILPPLLDRLAQWKQQNRSYLFAGIVVGWETGIPDNRNWKNYPTVPRDEQRHITMTPAELDEQLGYASLYARGWTQKKIEAKARESGKSVEDVTNELLYQVVHDYIAFWAKTVNDAGIPKERIYTHGVAWESVPEQRLPLPWLNNSSRVPPVWVYVNPYCRPGYTMGDGEFEPDAFVRLLRAAGVTEGWGAVEAYVHGVESQAAFGDYLRQLFGNGAHLVDIWGWTATGGPYDPTRAPGALRAIHDWLQGKDLPVMSPIAQQQARVMSPDTLVASLQTKMERLHALLDQGNQEGADMQPVAALMQGFEPLMQQQKFAEAEALIDHALDVANKLGPSAQTGPPQLGDSIQANQDTRYAYRNPEIVTLNGYSGPQEDPVMSPDGQHLFFDSNNDAGQPSYLYYAQRMDYKTFQFLGKLPGVEFQGVESTEDSAHNIYFVSPVFLKQGAITIAHGIFAGGSVTSIAPVRGISPKPAASGMRAVNFDISITPDGTVLYFSDFMVNATDVSFRGVQAAQLSMATKNADGSFTRASNSDEMLKNVNATGKLVYNATPSPDGLAFAFNAAPYFGPHPKIYIATRSSTSDPFGMPELITAADEVPGQYSEPGSFSPDGMYIYFHRILSDSSSQLYVLTRH